MKEKSSFGRVHFREICSVCVALVFLIAFTVVFKLSSPEGLIIQSVESIAILAIFYFVGKNRQVKAILDLRFLVRAFLLGVIIGVLLYCSEINPIIIISAGFIFFTVLDLISKILINSIENKTQQQTLQNESSASDSSKKNKVETVTAFPQDKDENHELSEDEQMNLFKGSNAKQKVKKYIATLTDQQNFKGLSNQFFFKLLEQPYALEVFELYCSKCALNLVQILRLFEIEEAEKFVCIYIKYHRIESEYAEFRMLNLPNAKEFMPDYWKKYYDIPAYISDSPNVFEWLRALLYNAFSIVDEYPHIFNLPNSVTMWKETMNIIDVDGTPKYIIDEMLKSPQAAELTEIYIEAGGKLTEGQVWQMFALSNADKLALLYIEKKNEFFPSIAPMIFRLSNAAKVWKTYLDNKDVDDIPEYVIDEMLKSPQAAELAEIYIEAGGELTVEQERQMFALPNASKLVIRYIEKGNEFYASTEPLIFGLSNAVEVWKTYLDKINIDTITRDTVEQMLVSPQASEFAEIYIKAGGKLTEWQIKKLLTLSNSHKLLSIYVKKDNDNIEQVENIIFDAPDEEKKQKLFKIIIDAKEELNYSYSEIIMMNLPDGAKLLEEYIRYDSRLGDDSQMAMFNLPDAKRLVLLYEEKRGLCKDAKALAQAKGWL